MNAREVARRVLARVEDGAYATLALAGELERARLQPKDRALATELAYGVLKRRLRLDHALAAYAPRGLDALDARVRDALRVGAYQILFMRVPAHAAVDDAVQAVKRVRGAKLAGFVNALLRRLARDGEPPLPDPADVIGHLSVRESAPRWLVEDALRRFSVEEAGAYLASLNAPAPVWLRVNTLRARPEEVVARLAEERPEAQVTRHPEVEEAVRVEGAGDLAQTRVFAEGLVTAQDLAAQQVARLLGAAPGETLLDACAGVGGKSTHLAQLTGDAARIDAADLSERKLELSADHARRLGLRAIRTIACDLTDPAVPLAASYDRILLDAPCTGLGVLRRHPEAKWRRRPEDARALAALQARLLAALLPRLRPGGTLVYSVCTYTDEEGPAQVAALGDAVTPAGPPLRTWPHRHDADAFFAQALIKSS